MAGRNLIKKLKALILVRVPLETLPTNGKNKFDSYNKSNYKNSKGNNTCYFITLSHT